MSDAINDTERGEDGRRALADPRVWGLLDALIDVFRHEVGSGLLGVTLHGSLALGGFRWDGSDVDILVVVERPLSETMKRAVVAGLVTVTSDAPPKGIELSVVTAEALRRFHHPLAYELHFAGTSASHHVGATFAPDADRHDVDLAAHLTIALAHGITLVGPPLSTWIPSVPREVYLDAILADAATLDRVVLTDPVYAILNLCRVLAYVEDGLIVSKREGATWGLRTLPTHARAIRWALARYCGEVAPDDLPSETDRVAFAADMLARIGTETSPRLA